MKIAEAIERFERARNNTLALPGRIELIDAAISALRAQQEREKNEPLTLEELQKMDARPVCVTYAFGINPMWYIVDVEENELKNPWDRISLEDWDEGRLFKAYRRPPNR